MSKLAYYLGAGMWMGGHVSHQPLPPGGCGRNGSPPGLCYIFRKLNRGSSGIPEPSAVLCTKQGPNVAWMSTKKLKSAEKIWLSPGNLHVRGIPGEWREEIDNSYLWKAVGGNGYMPERRGPPLNSHVTAGCHGNSAFAAWSTHGARTKGLSATSASGPTSQRPRCLPLKWPRGCVVYSLPFSCKPSSRMWAGSRYTGFLHIRTNISS